MHVSPRKKAPDRNHWFRLTVDPPGVFRVRLEDIRLGPNVSAGMNIAKLVTFAYKLLTEIGDPLPPIEVAESTGCFQVIDGRHRLVAAMIAGRPDVQAFVERPISRLEAA